jgi:hypothetical protein
MQDATDWYLCDLIGNRRTKVPIERLCRVLDSGVQLQDGNRSAAWWRQCSTRWQLTIRAPGNDRFIVRRGIVTWYAV